MLGCPLAAKSTIERLSIRFKTWNGNSTKKIRSASCVIFFPQREESLQTVRHTVDQCANLWLDLTSCVLCELGFCLVVMGFIKQALVYRCRDLL